MVQNEKVRKEFAQRLAQACKEAGLDEHGRGMAIARALSLSSKGVSKWFNAESLPRQEKMNALAKFLNVDVVWLQHGTSLNGANDEDTLSFVGKLKKGLVRVVGEAILGVDGDNVRIVAEQDVSNVNYSAIDEWLDYYYDHINKKSKKYVVKNKYCNMNADDGSISSLTNCSSYTDEQEVSILSASDINQAGPVADNYLYPNSISWVRNSKNDDVAYAVRNVFYNSDSQYMSFDKDYNFGVRPVITIQGDALVVDGDGTQANPYSIGDFESASTNDLVNTRSTGEYISYSGILWRIIDVDNDGTTKVIANTTLYNNGERVLTYYDTNATSKIYNPTQRGNVGYFINNQASQFVDTEYFANKVVEVPIYKNDIKYGNESTTKKYKVKLSAPDMYEMFSAFNYNDKAMKSYWLINSSRKQYTKAVISDIGVVMYGNIYDYDEYGVRPVGYLDKDCVIVRGRGTVDNPYIITKE